MTGLAIFPTQNHHVIALASLVKQVETGGSAVTSSSDFRRPTNLGPGVEALRAKWGWIVALGTIYVLVGLIALYSVVMATVASVFVVGIMMLIAGVAEVSNAFQVKSWGKFLLWILLGVLYRRQTLCHHSRRKLEMAVVGVGTYYRVHSGDVSDFKHW